MTQTFLMLSGNLFNFQNQSCDCLIDISHDSNGKEVKVLRIRAKKNEYVQFAYVPKSGLVKIDSKTGSQASNDVLGDLISISYNNLDGLIDFFHRYGFFIPVSDKEYETFPCEVIFALHRRIRLTIELMTLLQAPRKQYIKILSILSWLTFIMPVTLQSIEYDKESYQTCIHTIHRYIEASENKNDSTLLSTVPYDTNEGYFQIPDSIRPPYTQIKYEDYNGYNNVPDWGYTHEDVPDPSILDNQTLIYMFKNFIDIPPEHRRVIEYFYHFQSEIGIIKTVNQDGTLQFKHDIEANYKKYFDDAMKRATIDIAKFTLKEELDYALYGITASYNADTMSPSWYIPDLISSLFFSIFYMRPEMELYRQCANPSCGQYFKISATNCRKIYCESDCANAVAQRKHRKRRQEQKEKEMSTKC